MKLQGTTDLILAFLLFSVGIGVGIGGTVLYQQRVVGEQEEEPALPPSCSDPWGLNFINQKALERYTEHFEGQGLISNIQVSRPLTSNRVRTLSLSQFGNDCYGELAVSYVEAVAKTREELPPLTLTDDGVYVDSQGNEFTDWYKYLQKQVEVPVTYERYLTDDESAWIQIKAWDTPDVDFSDLFDF